MFTSFPSQTPQNGTWASLFRQYVYLPLHLFPAPWILCSNDSGHFLLPWCKGFTSLFSNPVVQSLSCFQCFVTPRTAACQASSFFIISPFSSHLQSFPASRSFAMSWLFTSGGQSICNITSVLSPSLSLTLLGGMPRWSPSPSRVSGGQSLAGTVESVLLQGDPKLVERPQCPALPFPPRITEVVALAGQSSHRLSQMTVVNF